MDRRQPRREYRFHPTGVENIGAGPSRIGVQRRRALGELDPNTPLQHQMRLIAECKYALVFKNPKKS